MTVYAPLPAREHVALARTGWCWAERHGECAGEVVTVDAYSLHSDLVHRPCACECHN